MPAFWIQTGVIWLLHRLLKDDKVAIPAKQKESKWLRIIKKLELFTGENNNKLWVKGLKEPRTGGKDKLSNAPTTDLDYEVN